MTNLFEKMGLETRLTQASRDGGVDCVAWDMRPVPTQNAYVESFNGRFRDECLNEHQFATLGQARLIIEAWRIDYNTDRPHQALENRTPEEFARGLQIMLPLQLSAA